MRESLSKEFKKEQEIFKMALINRLEHLNKKPHHEKAE